MDWTKSRGAIKLTMKQSQIIYIVLTPYGVDRMHKSEKFSMNRNERKVTVEVEWDTTIFEPEPPLKATIALESKHASDADPIVLDPQPSGATGRNASQTGHLTRIAAKVLNKAIASNDPEMKELAIASLAECEAVGISVRIEIPSEPENEEPE